MSADVLFRDEAGRILLIDPAYKPDWDLPGGMAEANEAPLAAARREVAEELGIAYAGAPILVIDWVSPHGPWDDSLAFGFDGGVLGAGERSRIRLRDGELRDFRFVAALDAVGLLRACVCRRLTVALSAVDRGSTAYLQDGIEAR